MRGGVGDSWELNYLVFFPHQTPSGNCLQQSGLQTSERLSPLGIMGDIILENHLNIVLRSYRRALNWATVIAADAQICSLVESVLFSSNSRGFLVWQRRGIRTRKVSSSLEQNLTREWLVLTKHWYPRHLEHFQAAFAWKLCTQHLVCTFAGRNLLAEIFCRI